MKIFIIFLLIFSLSYAQEGIIVKGKKESYKPVTISNQEARKTPGTLGEPLRVIDTLPGVVIPSFLGGDIVVRGANPNSNAYYIDDLPIFYPFHFLGLNSVISNHIWEDFTLETGAYSSIYANAIGGVIGIVTKERIFEENKSLVSSFFASQIHWEQKLKGHEITLAGRVNYMRETYGRLNLVEGGIRLPTYNDTQFKYNYIYNPNHSFQIYNLTSNDSFSLDLSQNQDTTNTLVTGAKLASARGFHTAALRHKYSSSLINNRLTFIYYKPWQKVQGELGNLQADYYESFGYFSIRQDLDWSIIRGIKIKQGIELRKLNYISEGFTFYQTNPSKLIANPFEIENPDYLARDINESQTIWNPASYFEIAYSIANWKLFAGIRWEKIFSYSQNSTTPRARIEYFLPQGWSAFVRGGLTSRFPFGNELSQKSGNPRLEFEKNLSSGIGVRKQWSNSLSLQVELFEQKLSNLVVADAYSGEYFLKKLTPEVLEGNSFFEFRKNFFSNSGEGNSAGIEFFLKKSNLTQARSSWGGWISYSYSTTFRNPKIHEPIYENYNEIEKNLFPLWKNSKKIYYDYDQRHIFNLVFQFIPSNNWLFGLRWQYRTSFPYTQILGDDGGDTRNPYSRQRIYFPIYSTEKNTERLPPYHRLDLRFDKIFNYEWGKIIYFLEFINAYARTNYINKQFKSGRPFSEINPTNTLDPAILPIRNFTNLPLINFGIEVIF